MNKNQYIDNAHYLTKLDVFDRYMSVFHKNEGHVLLLQLKQHINSIISKLSINTDNFDIIETPTGVFLFKKVVKISEDLLYMEDSSYISEAYIFSLKKESFIETSVKNDFVFNSGWNKSLEFSYSKNINKKVKIDPVTHTEI